MTDKNSSPPLPRDLGGMAWGFLAGLLVGPILGLFANVGTFLAWDADLTSRRAQTAALSAMLVMAILFAAWLVVRRRRERPGEWMGLVAGSALSFFATMTTCFRGVFP